jgi:hypothetical protein
LQFFKYRFDNFIGTIVGLFFIFCILVNSCSLAQPTAVTDKDEIKSDTILFVPAVAAGVLNNKIIDEASGMVMSIQNSNVFWTHNDSGDSARIFLVNTLAEYQLTCTLENAQNRDWEDIAIHKDTKSGKNKIFIGDIGDNNAVHSYCTIYIMDEPIVNNNGDITISNSEKITYKYEDGPRDAETLMVDPTNGDIYIVSKREQNVGLFRIAYPHINNDTVIAQKVMTLPITNVVGGDISHDGNEILMKTYQKIYYWPKINGETIFEALAKKPIEIPYQIEPQGESICWSADAKSFFTLSEETILKVTPILYRYDRK